MSASKSICLHQLLILVELGDRKPSQLLRKMKQLLGERVLEERILQQNFLQWMPTYVQLILALTSQTISLDQLALIADNLLEVFPSQPTLAADTQPPQPPVTSPGMQEVQDLPTQVNDLTTQLATLVNMIQITPHSRSRGHSPHPCPPHQLPSIPHHEYTIC